MGSYPPHMTEWYDFECANCPAAFEVDGAAREELLSAGCPECGAGVVPSAFEPRADAPQMLD